MRNTAPKPPTAEQLKENRDEFIDKYMADLKREVKLDDLQEIAIKNEIVNNNKTIDIIMKKEDSQEIKSKEVLAIREKTESTILSYLSKEQKIKYETFKESLLKKKKDKKGKKDKKEDHSAEEELKQ